MITVTGATGKLGRVVLDDLRSRVPADQIVAVARTPEKVEGVAARRGDYDDPASLRAAFAGSRTTAVSSAAGTMSRRAARVAPPRFPVAPVTVIMRSTVRIVLTFCKYVPFR